MRSTTALLLIADGRLPSAGHAHSGGVEAAVQAGRVHDLASLAGFLRGRLHTAGLVAAAFAACATQRARAGLPVADLDGALDARTASPALRKASRAQGRALLRAGRAMWLAPATRAEPDHAAPPATPAEPADAAQPSHVDSAHHAVALGILAAAAGLTPADAALAAAYGSVAGPATAAVRLLALDPYPVQGLLAALAAACDAIAARAAAYADCDAHDLPATSAPLLDIGAEDHATWEVRLFAS